MIQAVIFDFGNVISAFDTSLFLRRLTLHSPLPLPRLSDEVYGSGLHARFEAGAIGTPAFYREVVRRCRATTMPMTEFVEAFNAIFEPVAGTADLIRRLSARMPVALLSNTNPCHFRHHIRRSPPFRCFSAVTLSYRVKALKPAPAIYADAITKLALPARSCVYVDDIPEYAQGATRAGLHGVVFKGASRFEEELRQLGVDVS